MLADDNDKLPVVGETRSHLGAMIATHKSADLIHDENGIVQPKKGGMSVFWGDPRMMSRPRRPRELGGDGDLPLFQMDEGDMPPTLSVDRNGMRKKKPDTHATVEPKAQCHKDEYQGAIHSTRPKWRPYPGEPGGK